MRMTSLGAIIALAAIVPAHAQAVDSTFPIDPSAPRTQNEGLRDTGQTAETGAGEVGQRQTRRDAAASIDVAGRIDNRIRNRIQNRIRNRIDRNYDPTANATSPFELADEEARSTGRPR